MCVCVRVHLSESKNVCVQVGTILFECVLVNVCVKVLADVCDFECMSKE